MLGLGEAVYEVDTGVLAGTNQVLRAAYPDGNPTACGSLTHGKDLFMPYETQSPLTRRAFTGGSTFRLVAACSCMAQGRRYRPVGTQEESDAAPCRISTICVLCCRQPRDLEIDRITPVTGATLAVAPRLDVVESARPQPRVADSLWQLQGVTTNVRYTTHGEVTELKAKQKGGLNRPDARRAALIPVRKTGAW